MEFDKKYWENLDNLKQKAKDLLGDTYDENLIVATIALEGDNIFSMWLDKLEKELEKAENQSYSRKDFIRKSFIREIEERLA